MEPQVQAARRESLEEADERLAISLARRAQPKGASVAENDVQRLAS